MNDRQTETEKKPGGRKKKSEEVSGWTTEGFKKQVLKEMLPYFIISCACKCGRLNCPAAEKNDAGKIFVLAVANVSEDQKVQMNAQH